MKNLLKIILKIFIFIAVVLTVIIGCYIATGHSMYEKALKETPIEDVFDKIKQRENYTKLDELPKIYIDAVIAVEDHRFYEHMGVDYIAVLRAVIHDISNQALIQGGSTITQQLCKNEFFTQDKKLERKIAECFMAAEVERNYEKDEILEIYINSCFYGNNCYTPKEAAKLYFDKELSQLTDYEAILIAGIPNAPSLYNPIHSMDLAKQRLKQVLEAMVTYGKITAEQKEQILAQGESQ